MSPPGTKASRVAVERAVKRFGNEQIKAQNRNGFGPDGERPQCTFQRPNGARCKRRTAGATEFCSFHNDVTQGLVDPHRSAVAPSPTRSDLVKSSMSSMMTRRHKQATKWVLDTQARNALNRLHHPDAGDPDIDPKEVLLDSVRSSWRQRQVWESMLASIPDEDYEYLGTPAVPGMLSMSKGARIETIQKMLTEATKMAARTSKMAIDAGIEERLVKLAEDQAALIADTVRAALVASLARVAAELNLAPAVRAQITEVAMSTAAQHLRVLAAGGEEVIEGVSHIVHEPSHNSTDGALRSRQYRERKARRDAASKPSDD